MLFGHWPIQLAIIFFILTKHNANAAGAGGLSNLVGTAMKYAPKVMNGLSGMGGSNANSNQRNPGMGNGVNNGMQGGNNGMPGGNNGMPGGSAQPGQGRTNQILNAGKQLLGQFTGGSNPNGGNGQGTVGNLINTGKKLLNNYVGNNPNNNNGQNGQNPDGQNGQQSGNDEEEEGQQQNQNGADQDLTNEVAEEEDNEHKNDNDEENDEEEQQGNRRSSKSHNTEQHEDGDGDEENDGEDNEERNEDEEDEEKMSGRRKSSRKNRKRNRNSKRKSSSKRHKSSKKKTSRYGDSESVENDGGDAHPLTETGSSSSGSRFRAIVSAAVQTALAAAGNGNYGRHSAHQVDKTQCEDDDPADCRRKQFLCSQAAYELSMHNMCPVACRICNEGDPMPTYKEHHSARGCNDANEGDCVRAVQLGYCNTVLHPDYADFMTRMCSISCGKCTANLSGRKRRRRRK